MQRKVWLALGLLVAAGRAQAGTAILTAVKDNTIYSDATSRSNGAGAYVFAGRNNMGGTRRGLVMFDVSGIPAGSTIVSVELELYCAKAAPGSPAQTVGLHRLLASWGEAGSDAGLEEGQGAPAQVGDATWTTRFFGSPTPWIPAGGQFTATASGTASVGAPGFFYTWSSAGMADDVQAWLDDSASNHGWLLKGNEASSKTARRFGSDDNEFAGFWPTLTIEYSAPASSPGAVPDGDEVPGTPLAVARAAAGAVELSWGTSCAASADDYAIYEGSIGAFASYSPVTCTTLGLESLMLPGTGGSTFWLVVPVSTSADLEGSYGRSGDGSERPPSSTPCFPQSLDDPVCP